MRCSFSFILSISLAIAAFVLCVSAPAYAQQASANQAFIERASLRSADDRCKLLSARERLALEMGYWQARGALLRSGYSNDDIFAWNEEASTYAAAKDCDDQLLVQSVERLKDAFVAFSRTPFYEFQGDERKWTALRTLTDVWATYQEDVQANVRFGYIHLKRAKDPLSMATPGETRPPSQLGALLKLDKKYTPPVTARLIVRDSSKYNIPWLGGLFNQIAGLNPPPKSLTSQFFASERLVVDSMPYGDGKDTQGALFLFSESAVKAIHELDPREAIVLEFQPSARDKEAKLVRAVMEVGDFRSAAAFSAIERDKPNPDL